MKTEALQLEHLQQRAQSLCSGEHFWGVQGHGAPVCSCSGRTAGTMDAAAQAILAQREQEAAVRE